MKAFQSYPLKDAYRLIEPGPVTLVTTSLKDKINVMTMSWITMIEFTPPQLACVMSEANYSFEALKKTKECVINIPTEDIAKKVVQVGNTTGADIDKFKKFGLTPLPASTVEAPLIEECYACLECKVVDTRMVKKYNLFILEVQKVWIKQATKSPATLHHTGRGYFRVAGKTIKLPSRMK